MWKLQGSTKQVATRNLICLRKIFMIFRGESLREKQFMTFSVCIKHKKDKKNVHLDLTYYQGNKTCIHTPVM